jgi:hypothetical protein
MIFPLFDEYFPINKAHGQNNKAVQSTAETAIGHSKTIKACGLHFSCLKCTFSLIYVAECIGDSGTPSSSTFLLGKGYFRDVWCCLENPRHRMDDQTIPEASVLETFRFEKELSESRWDDQRIDAIISERLTSSPNVLVEYVRFLFLFRNFRTGP